MTIGRTQLGPQCQGHKQTTDATADQLLLTCPIPFKHSATVDLWIIGIATSGDKLVEHSVHSVTRDGATATYVGEVSNGSYSSGAGAWVTTVDCTGTGLRVRVTGEAAHTIEWHCVARFEPSAVNVPILAEWSTEDTTQSIQVGGAGGEHVYFDWGDGSFTDHTVVGWDTVNHNYAAAGNYAVRISTNSPGTLTLLLAGAAGMRGSIDLITIMTGASRLGVNDQYISGSIPDLTPLVLLKAAYLQGNALAGYAASTIAASCVNFQVHNNLLPQSAVDQIMADFLVGASGRPAAGAISLGGSGNAPLSAAGLASKAAFLAIQPAWVITHK